MMELRFRCHACGEFVKWDRKLESNFSEWSYDYAEWSDFGEDVPPLYEEFWSRSVETPKIGETKSIKVHQPFDENIGNEFNIIFEPEEIFFNGWNSKPDDIDKCAIIYCRFEKILLQDDYNAWISVKILDVKLLPELYKEPITANVEGVFEEYINSKRCNEEYFRNEHWIIKGWSGQGDIGEIMYIYIDDNEISHLVMLNFYAFHENIIYIGNII